MTCGTNNGVLRTTDTPTTRANLGITSVGEDNTPLNLALGGTNSSPATNSIPYISSGTSILFRQITSNGTTLISGTSGTVLSAAALIGTNITITNGANSASITMSASSASAIGGFTFATDAEAVTGTNTLKAICPASLFAKLAAPGAIGGTTPAAGTFTTITIGAIGDVQILAFSGDPNGTVTAPQGSWCINIGTPVGLVDRVFINTDSGTTWTGITSVA